MSVNVRLLQSLALDVKVLRRTANRSKSKDQDDDMIETAKDIGLLLGDEGPRMSQTMVAAREAETMRAAAVAAPAIGEDGEIAVSHDEPEEDNEAEASDE